MNKTLKKALAKELKREIKEIDNLKILFKYQNSEDKKTYINKINLCDFIHILKKYDKNISNNNIIEKINFILLDKTINFFKKEMFILIFPTYEVIKYNK